MLNLRETEKEFLESHVIEGGTAVDFTMGNGNDTLWLSQKIGSTGHVYAFDIQQAALDSTRARQTVRPRITPSSATPITRRQSTLRLPFARGSLIWAFFPAGTSR